MQQFGGFQGPVFQSPPPLYPGNPFQVVGNDNLYVQQHNNVELIPNPSLILKRKINFILFSIIWLSSAAIIISYIVVIVQITSQLDLLETGNWWAFLMLFGTSTLVLITGFPLLCMHYTKFKMRFANVKWFDILLLGCWIAMAFVALGANQSYQDRSKCKDPNVKCTKNWAPSSPTQFGIYIDGVCGNGSLSANTKKPILKDDTKCDVAKRLQTAIYSMYSWAIELLIVQMLDNIFGLGSFRDRNEPEMIPGRSPRKTDEMLAWS